jgi:hypothetical protein
MYVGPYGINTASGEWIHVTVEPYTETEREQWLNTITSTRYDIEALVSLLAAPDDKALKAFLKYLPPPPSPADKTRVSLRVGINYMRSCLAPAALGAFPDPLVKKLISQVWLENIRRTPAYCSWRRF